MTCLEAEEQLLEAIDGALAGPERQALDAHLTTCARCPAFAASLLAVDAALTTALPPPVVPASIAVTVRTRVRRERRAVIRGACPTSCIWPAAA